MKKILVFATLWLGGVGLRAQSFAEWFEQNKTRLQYYEEQVASLTVYTSELEKGYQLVEEGLQTIGQIKHGEFDAHNAFYASLESINPGVAGMAEVTEIVSLQLATLKKFSQSMAAYQQNKYLQSSELGVIGEVYAGVVSAGLADVSTLTDILTASRFQLTDANRMEQIQRLDQDARGRFAFTSSFTGETDLLTAKRQAEDTDIGNLKAWYGLS